MEFFDLYSLNRSPLGKSVRRGDPIKHGEYHIVVQVMVINSYGEILLTQRVPEKTSGGKWECSGGCAISGETAKAAAIRELYEETGIVVHERKMLLEWSITADSMLRDFFVVRKDVALRDIRLQKNEVCAAKWVSFERLQEMVMLGETTRTIEKWLDNRTHQLRDIALGLCRW